MEYSLFNSIAQVDQTISGAYYALIVNGTGLVRLVDPPATSTSAGVSGYNVAFDGTYFYGCTGTNQWGRVQLTTF